MFSPKCKVCGVRYEVDESTKLCNKCKKKLSKEKLEKDKIADKQKEEEKLKIEIQKIKITTTNSIAGYDIIDTIDIVSSECALGMNIFRDFFSSVRDIVGGRSVATQKILKEVKSTCLRELKKETYHLGGNGIIGIDLDYSEFSGGGKSMLFLVANGTAVKIKKIDKMDTPNTQ